MAFDHVTANPRGVATGELLWHAQLLADGVEVARLVRFHLKARRPQVIDPLVAAGAPGRLVNLDGVVARLRPGRRCRQADGGKQQKTPERWNSITNCFMNELAFSGLLPAGVRGEERPGAGLADQMQLFAFGINHQTAPLEVRERVAFNADGVPDALRDLVDHEPVREAAIISTCNRTEVYCNTQEPATAVRWLAGYHQMKPSDSGALHLHAPTREQRGQTRVPGGERARLHGARRAADPRADEASGAQRRGGRHAGTGPAQVVSADVLGCQGGAQPTEIGASSVSMAAAAVRLAERIYPSISEQRILIGAGEMIELSATHFGAQRPRAVTFANRTLERAQELAQRFAGQAVSLNDLSDMVAGQDILVTCTASPLPIIGKGLIERALKARRHRPMLIIDLAVPRDVESEVAGWTTCSCTRSTIWARWCRKGAPARVGGEQGGADHRREGDRLHAVAGQPRGGADHPRAARPG